MYKDNYKGYGEKQSTQAQTFVGCVPTYLPLWCSFDNIPSYDPAYGASGSHTSDTSHSVELLWMSDQPDAGTSTGKHTTLTRNKYQCHDGVKRTRNPNQRAAADPRLKPRGTGIGLPGIQIMMMAIIIAIIIYLISQLYDIFAKCNWVDTRWQ